MHRGRNRKIIANKKEVRRLKKILKETTKSTEIKRLEILIEYLSGSTMDKVYSKLKCSKETISKTIQKYINDKENFYKTSHKGWAGKRVNRSELKRRVKIILKNNIKPTAISPIKDLCEVYNMYYDTIPLNYYKTWIVVRKKLNLDINNFNQK